MKQVLILGVLALPLQYSARAIVICLGLNLIGGVSFHGNILEGLWLALSLELAQLLLATAIITITTLGYFLIKPLAKRINATATENMELKLLLGSDKRSTRDKMRYSIDRSSKELIPDGISIRGAPVAFIYKSILLLAFAHFYPATLTFASWQAAALTGAGLCALDAILTLIFNSAVAIAMALEKKKKKKKKAELSQEEKPSSFEKQNKLAALWNQALVIQEERDLSLAPYNLEVQLNANSPDVYMERGKVLLRLEEKARAYEDFNKAIKLNGNLAEAYHRRGEALAKMGLRHLAIQDLSIACRLYQEQNNLSAWKEANAKLEELKTQIAASKPLLQTGKETVAHTKFFFQPDAIHEIQKLNIESADKELGQNALSAPTYCKRAKSLCSEKQYQQALDDYNRALQLSPEYADALRGRGETYFGLKEYQKSIPDFTEALRLNANDTDALRGRSFSYSCLGQWQEALDDMTLAMKFNQSNDLKIIRAQILLSLNRSEEALKDLNSYISTRESAVIVWSVIFLPIFREIAFQLKSGLPDAYRMRAKLHEEAGNQTLAAADMAAAQKIEKELSKRKQKPD